MFGSLIDALGDLVSTYGGGEESQQGRAFAAYRDAYREKQTGDDSIDPLIHQMKAHGVAGAYTDALQRPELGAFFAAWAAGLDPDVVRSNARRGRRLQNRWPTLRRRAR